MKCVCEAFGVTDISGEVMGKRNVYSQLQALFDAFSKHKSYEDDAWGRGRRVRDLGLWSVKNIRDDDYSGMMQHRDKL